MVLGFVCISNLHLVTLSLFKSWVFFNEFSSLVLLNWVVDFVVLGLGFACR